MESEQEYKITIKPFSNDKLIHVYKSNPEYGYVVLESDESFFCPTLLRDINLKSSDVKSFKFPKRQALLRGKTETLKKFVKASHGKTLPGRIIVTEYLEDEIPEDVKSENLRDDVPFEEAIKPYLLLFKNKNNSIENRIRDRFKEKLNDEFLTKNGKRILRFFKYHAKEETKDILIKGFDIKFDTLKIKFTGVEDSGQQNSEDIFDDLQNKERKVVNIVSAPDSIQRERSLASVKRENAVMLPLVALLVLGAIVALIMLPSLFTAVSLIVGSIIIFYFAGVFYEAIFSKQSEFDLLKTILVGIVVIIILGIFLFIGELTKTPYDPEMWRHP